MDNAMVKRGIGAVVLAIIAALLLGFLLKDKSRDRQDAIKSELNIPALSDASDKATDSAAILIDETKQSVSNANSDVVASATATLKSVTDGASSTLKAVTDGASNTLDTATQNIGDTIASTASLTSTQDTSNPGFSFRPPAPNEEQQINTNTTAKSDTVDKDSSKSSSSSNNQVVASAPKTEQKAEKKFKPTIENEPKRVVKKTTKKVVKKSTVAKKKPATKKAEAATKKTSTNGKYAIQLLATSSQSRAKKLATTMIGEGYVSYITQTSNNNKILYRVRIGGHQNRNAALKAQQAMKKRYQKNFFVQNSLVVSNN